jgi:succinate dehydrogenase/fumarate reductase flavoprotein subunit
MTVAGTIQPDLASAATADFAAARAVAPGRQPVVRTADVVVVGGGGSGLAAAIEACSTGRSVILIEKNAALGGTTSRSVGSLSGAATPYQIRRGIKDAPQDHYDDIPKFQGPLRDRDNPHLRKVLTDNVTDTIRWLMDSGIEFMGPMPEPPHRRDRMINILPNSRAYAYHLEKRARREGVEIVTRMRATRLLHEGAAMVGVRCVDGAGAVVDFRARGGVVLAAGDYAASYEMKSRFQPDLFARIEAVNPTATGDGQVMAVEAGGRVINGDVFNCGIRFVPPTRRSFVQFVPPWRPLMRFARFALDNLPGMLIRPMLMRTLTSILVPSAKLFQEGAVLVNAKGELIDVPHSEMTAAVASQPDQIAYIVFDQNIATKFRAWPYDVSTAPGIAYAYLQDYRKNRPDIYNQAPDLAALARKIGASPAMLQESIASYNRSSSRTRPQLAKGPYYALGPVKTYNNFTDGGLAVNENLEVLDAQDKPIPGLFAAGANGQGGLILKGHGHHLGWAFTSGRIAGRNAAFRIVDEVVAAEGGHG